MVKENFSFVFYSGILSKTRTNQTYLLFLWGKDKEAKQSCHLILFTDFVCLHYFELNRFLIKEKMFSEK